MAWTVDTGTYGTVTHMPPELLTTSEIFQHQPLHRSYFGMSWAVDTGMHSTVTHMSPELLTTGEMSLAFQYLHCFYFVYGL